MTKTFKKHILISSIALAFATLQSAQAAPSANYEESLNNSNPELTTDITANGTKDAVEIWGAGSNYVIIGKQVTANKNSSAIALSISGGSTSTAAGEVHVNATDSTFKATTTGNTAWAKALNISLPNHDNPLTIKGGTFIAEGAGGTSQSAAVYMKAAVNDKQYDVTFDGAAFEAGGGTKNYSFYFERNNHNVTDNITLNNSDIKSGDVYSMAGYAENHVVNFTVDNTHVGSAGKIAITAEALGSGSNPKSDENFTLTAKNNSFINADILAEAAYSGDKVEFNLNLNGGSTLAGNISTKGLTGAASTVTANLVGPDTKWEGDLLIGKQVTSKSTVTLKDGAAWTGDVRRNPDDVGSTFNQTTSVTVGKDSVWVGSVEAELQKTTTVNLDGGSWLVVGDHAFTEPLTATNAVINVEKGSISADKMTLTDSTLEQDLSLDHKLSVKTASGTLAVKNVGDWSSPLVEGNKILDVTTDASGLTVTGEEAEAGFYKYVLTKHEGTTANAAWWSYEKAAGLSNGGALSSALTVSPLNVANEQINALNDHRAAVRSGDEHSTGVWVAALGGKEERTTAIGADYDLDVTGAIVGSDVLLPVEDGNWVVGGAFSYAKGDVDAIESSGDIDAWALQAYATRTYQSGLFFDASAFLGRFSVDADLQTSGQRLKGSYDTNGLGLTAGAGWTLRPAEGIFVEPFAKLSYVTLRAKDYALGTGTVSQDKVYSLQAEAGARFGAEFTAAGAEFRPYLLVSGVNEFNQNTVTRIGTETADSSIDGAALRVGAGLSVNFTKALSANAAVNYMKGDAVENPVYGSVGVSYRW